MSVQTRTHSGKKVRITAQYDYVDESGMLLYQVCRYEPKTFRQRRPDGNGGWIWNLEGTRPVLYRLPGLLAASLNETVFVVEGEEDADRLTDLGCTATCNPGGAGKWRPEFNEHFAGRDVVVLADNDGPGLVHANDVAGSLFPVAASVRVVWLAGLPKSGDVSDWLDAEHTISELSSIIERTPHYVPPSTESDGQDNVVEFTASATAKPPRKSHATRLVEVLPDDADLFHTPDGTEFITVSLDGHSETHRVRSSAIRKYLSRLFYLAEGKAPGGQALHDAISLLCAQASYDGHEQQVYLRTAPREAGGCWLDLCDTQWRAIEITASGWSVVDSPPVRFRRAPGMLALPEPQRGGRLDELDEFLNLRSDDDRVLVRTIITSYMLPFGPYVVLCIHGEHGSCKSSAAKIIRSFIDPSAAPLSAPPHDEHDLVIAARNSWLINVDNLSRLDATISDALCRLATGGGLRTRKLYTDDEEEIFDAQRPILLNGIEAVATRGDLVDRSVTIYLEPIQPEQRREESEFWAAFEAARPRIMGALLDAMVGGLRQIAAGVRPVRKPRMADFAVWGVAAERPLGFGLGAFMSACEGNRADANSQALEASPVASAIMLFMNTVIAWTGTAGELLGRLVPLAGDAAKQKGWPPDATRLSNVLRRLAPNLRAAGLEIIFHPRENDRRLIEIVKRENRQDSVTSVT